MVVVMVVGGGDDVNGVNVVIMTCTCIHLCTNKCVSFPLSLSPKVSFSFC